MPDLEISMSDSIDCYAMRGSPTSGRLQARCYKLEKEDAPGLLSLTDMHIIHDLTLYEQRQDSSFASCMQTSLPSTSLSQLPIV